MASAVPVVSNIPSAHVPVGGNPSPEVNGLRIVLQQADSQAARVFPVTDAYNVVIRCEHPPAAAPPAPPAPTPTCAKATTAGWTLIGLGSTSFVGGVFTVASAFTFNTVIPYIAPMVTGGVAAVALGGVLAMAGYNRLAALRTVGF